jgi:ribosomal-protein-alanine N-acetyltransferase
MNPAGLMQIKLVSSSPDFASLFYQYRNQHSTLKHNPLESINLEECRERLKQESSNLTELWEKSRFRWLVEVDGNVVGNVSIKNVNKMMLSAEIAYGIAEDQHGKGYGTKSVELLVEMIFSQTPLRKLFAFVHDQNISSRKILLHNGFKEEGLLREHFIINGKPANEIIFGILNHEWRIAQNALRFVNLLVPGKFDEAKNWISPSCSYQYQSQTLSGGAIIKSFSDNHEKALTELDDIEYIEGRIEIIEGRIVSIILTDRLFARGKHFIHKDRLVITCNERFGEGSIEAIEHKPFEGARENLNEFLSSVGIQR